MTNLYFLILAMTAQVFISTAELAIPTGTPTNEANTKIKTHPVTAETKTRKCSKYFKTLHIFYVFDSSSHYFISSKRQFLLSSFFFQSKVKAGIFLCHIVFKAFKYYSVILLIVIRRK